MKHAVRETDHADAARFAIDAVASLGDNEIHVWHLTLRGSPTHREVTSAARSLLDALLMRYANLDHAPTIERTERGKPFAPDLPNLDFNLSHARDRVALAFARGQPLGIDIEHADRRLKVDELARRFFAAGEADALAALPAGRRDAAFLRLWTSKEAILKALGAGLSFGLDRVAFALDADGAPTALSSLADEAGAADEWRLVRIDPAADTFGALAWRGPDRIVRTFAADA
jgi:4'-phosphopantetheinyl transferase